MRWFKLVVVVALAGQLYACATAPQIPPQRAPRSAALAAAPQSVPADGPGLSPEQVSTVVEDKSLAVGGCHVVEFSGTEPVAGFVVLDINISPRGNVTDAEVSESSYAAPRLSDCVVGVARELQFPSAVGSTEVSWRFDFKGRSQASP